MTIRVGTRAIIEFIDPQHKVYVYQHWDGYPEHTIPAIKKALAFAWPLPRFEATDFAAAFVAANKQSGGNIYIVPTNDWRQSFTYVVQQNPNTKQIEVDCWEGSNKVELYNTFTIDTEE